MPKASTSRPLPQRKTRSYAYSDRPPLSRRHTSSSSSLLDQDDHPAGSTAITPVNILACFRESPRPCVNQDLLDKLKPLREERFLLYGSAHPKAISYATAISVIIGTPWKIRTAEQARSLPKVGEKIVTKIEEYLRTGEIDDAIRAGNNSKALALKDMSAVHGVGHVMANSLYTKGLRSLQEMRDSKQWEKEFQWHDDIQQKMPRHEVESIHEFIKIQIEKVEPGATTLLCGGYRRGKELSNDVDILITYAENDGKERGVLATLVERLRVKGFIPHDGVLSLHTPATERTITSNRPASSFDSLDKALIIFRHPANGTTRKRDHWRRVDLVVARWPQWGAAVVGWTGECGGCTLERRISHHGRFFFFDHWAHHSHVGSTQFERDLRLQAKKKSVGISQCPFQVIGLTDPLLPLSLRNLKFDSGGIHSRLTGEVIRAATEEDVFKVLGVPYLRMS
ncbi:BQ5605_C024g09852 [Microbotryum silenes-dioicae]|uniref:DNA polymerase n=1 Tax=Microbotryum silenes-dioicae TaxID=796604 RepID=A0A2X0MPZ5_9BASI|nr:BQ5605_C024g09852 [Microbotryum silenes-dioicae]